LDSSLAAVDFLVYFPGDKIFSAKSSLPAPTSKPDPAIYRHALQILGKSPIECIAVEDSVVGVMSARGAGVRVLGYVGCYGKEGNLAKMMAKELSDSGAEMVMEDWDTCETLLRLFESS
jgi:beta-phosphoglucomutase-like phosphatase (HAD superfamily)